MTRGRRGILAGAIVTAVVATVVVVTVRHHSSSSASASAFPLEDRGSWRALPPPPLSPRADPLAVWTGHEVIFLGGASKPCPPFINCDMPLTPTSEVTTFDEKTDGAAYDVATGTWRRLAGPPTRVGLETVVYAGGHVLVVDDRGRTWDYDVERDSWTRFRSRWDARDGVSAAGGRIYAMSSYDRSGGYVVSYRPSTSTWSRYPVDRLRPRLEGSVVATSQGPVLMGIYKRRAPYHHLPSTVVADAWTGHAWRRLPLTPQLDREYTWTGHRLVDPVQGTRYHGGSDAWPHRYPEGGALDPATGRWTALPAVWQSAEIRYADPTPGWDVDTLDRGTGPRFVVQGEVYDDDTGSAWLLPRPAGSPPYFASGVWAGGRLVVLGGASFDGQHQTGVSRRAWVYTP
ncbi:MAG TPA: hypothetical protein VH085_04335 [Nocardioides sp.]|nr:hypothetical protein [Nocardioides sp.]